MPDSREPYTAPADPELVATTSAAAFFLDGPGGDISGYASVPNT